MGAALIESLLRHKAGINEEFFAAVGRIDAEAHATTRQAAIRLLNHIFVVDRVFAAHLAGREHEHTATNTPETPTLDALRDAVVASDRWYVAHVGALTPQALAQTIAFRFTDGLGGRMSREEMLMHVITHGSYHRGGVERLLADAAVTVPRDLFTAYLHRTEPQRRDVD